MSPEVGNEQCNEPVGCVEQMEQAEGTTERRRQLECEKVDSEELQQKYKVRDVKEFYIVGHSGVVATTSHSQSREPGFESFHCCHFEACAISSTRRYLISLSCLNEYVAINSCVYVNE